MSTWWRELKSQPGGENLSKRVASSKAFTEASTAAVTVPAASILFAASKSTTAFKITASPKSVGAAEASAVASESLTAGKKALLHF